MAQQKTSSLKTYFDELEETNGDDECKAWLSRAFDSRAELAVFVAGRREGGGTGKYVGFLRVPSTLASASASAMDGRMPLFGFRNRDTRLQLIGTKKL
jgi:hypothetical protein